MSMPKVAESGRLGRAELLAKGGASGRMQRLTELVPIPESSVKALESCCILAKSRKQICPNFIKHSGTFRQIL